MMAKRLQLHRLQHFDLERLPSAEDVYLFRAVAKGNPRDERLFVVAEVRDLTPVSDAGGPRRRSCRSSSGCCSRRSARSAPCRRAGRPGSACTATA